MTTQLLIKLDSSTKEKLGFLAKRENESVNSVVRGLIDDFIKRRDISLYIDELWDRIGGDIKEKGISNSEINKAIKAVRRVQR